MYQTPPRPCSRSVHRGLIAAIVDPFMTKSRTVAVAGKGG